MVTQARQKRKYTRHLGSNPPGCPTKKVDKCYEFGYNLARTGHTIEEIADLLGIVESTVYQWIATDTKFSEAIKKGRSVAITRMENSLYHRGLGYSHPEEKIFAHKVGKRIKVTRVDTIMRYPADTAAAFIWLKNVDPEHWRDKTEVEIKGYLHKEFKELSPDDLMKEAERIALDITGKRTIPSKN